MIKQPTLIVLADPTPRVELFSMLDSTLQRGKDSGLPMVVVCHSQVAQQVRQILPEADIVEVPEGTSTAQAVSSGVQASAQASGWLILPANMPMLQPETLRQVAKAMAQHTVVIPQYHYQRGHPVGFSSELFSELIRLNSERDLERLTSRYPAVGVEVDDAGVLLTPGQTRIPSGIPNKPPLKPHAG